MGERRRHLTLGRLMLVIGAAAVVLAMSRVDTAPGVSLFIFAACTWYLAARRFAETMARRSAQGLTTGRMRKARILAGSAALAMVAIGLPDAAFLAGYYGFMEAIRAVGVTPYWALYGPVVPPPGYPVIRPAMPMPYWYPYHDPWHILAGAGVGIIAALYVAAIMKRWLGPIVGKTPAATGAAPDWEPVRSRTEAEVVDVEWVEPTEASRGEWVGFTHPTESQIRSG